MCIIVQPLKKLHVKLELAISHLFDLDPLVELQLDQHIIEHFQVPRIVILILSVEVQLMQRHCRQGMYRIYHLAEGNGITTHLYLRVISLCCIINPCKEFKSA